MLDKRLASDAQELEDQVMRMYSTSIRESCATSRTHAPVSTADEISKGSENDHSNPAPHRNFCFSEWS